MVVTRGITEIGLVSIGRRVRGPALNEEVVIQANDMGIVISPLKAHSSSDSEEKLHVSRFDQYNRILLPADMRRIAKINKRVDVTPDGDNLIITPVIDVCAICGTDKELMKVAERKFICESCRNKMLNT